MKINKISSILVMGMFFSIFLFLICIGCFGNRENEKSNDREIDDIDKEIKEEINASYILTQYNESDIQGEFKAINSYAELLYIYKTDLSGKYDEDFFDTHSLIIFKIIESSKETKSIIDFYLIKKGLITINVKTIEFGDDFTMSSWYFVLELEKIDLNNISDVEIVKNDVVITNTLSKTDVLNLSIKIENEIKHAYVLDFCKDSKNVNDIIIENYYGNYNGYEVVLIKDLKKGDSGVFRNVIIEDFIFCYPFGNREMLLWTGEDFLTLDVAFEKGFIHKDDLEKIFEIYTRK